MKNNLTKQKINYFLKVFAGHKTIQKCATKKWRRFLNNSRLIKWGLEGVSVYLRINYGKGEENHGKTVTFYNNGTFTNKTDFEQSLAAFLE